MRSSVSFGSAVFGSFFHLKKVDRAVSPSSVICSRTERFQSPAIRKNARNAGPDSRFRPEAVADCGCGDIR